MVDRLLCGDEATREDLIASAREPAGAAAPNEARRAAAVAAARAAPAAAHPPPAAMARIKLRGRTHSTSASSANQVKNDRLRRHRRQPGRRPRQRGRCAGGAWQRLPGCTLLAASSLYRTAPIDSSGDDYINAVARVDTTLTPKRCCRRCTASSRRTAANGPTATPRARWTWTCCCTA
jgi:hypothetical protein